MATNNANNEPTAASGKVLQGQGVGTASNYSTATYPSTATGAGTIMRADGTNWVATTATYPNTVTSADILYATSSNVVGSLAINTKYGTKVGTDSAAPVYLNPLQYVYWTEDFINISSNSLWAVSSLNAGTSSYSSGVTAAHPGVVNIGTGINTNGSSTLRISGNAGAGSGPILVGGGLISYTVVCQLSALSDGTDTYTARIGLGDNQGADNNNGCYFEYTNGTNSGQWVIKTANGGSRSTGNTSNAADTNYHRFRIDINAAGTSVAFYIDDIQVTNSPLAANIPTSSIGPNIQIVKSAGNTARSINVDYVDYYQKLTASR